MMLVVFKELRIEMRKVSEDNLKDWWLISPEFTNNSFHKLFEDLSKCMSTRPAYVEGTASYESCPSPESDLSTESSEDKDEEPSRLAFRGIMSPIALHKSFRPIQTESYLYVFRVYELNNLRTDV